MTVDRLPARVREFATYLDGLLARLDQGGGWCGVFWQRDPDGMQACLDGREVPPWDVVEALLQDLAAAYGPGDDVVRPERERARALHAAALTAHDARPGGRDALGDRLDVMLREQKYAAERQAELSRLLASAATREEADALRLDLAWARDDHERATARCAELRARMAELDRRAHGLEMQRRGATADGTVHRIDRGFPAEDARPGGHGSYDEGFPSMPRQRGASSQGAAADRHDGRQATAGAAAADPHDPRHGHPAPTGSAPGEYGNAQPAPLDPQPPAAQQPAPKQRKRRRGSARFAGMAEEEAAPVVVPPTAAPAPPTSAPTTRRTPRGARFAGAAEAVEQGASQAEVLDAEDWREVGRTVETLTRLRSEGRTGEAHALLVEIAYWPASRFPLLAAGMQSAGLGADWATLLWEAASLPAGRLVAAADALVEAGRTEDGQQILRQGVIRPAAEIGQSVLGLVAEGRHREVRVLLDAYVRVRTPEEAARSVAPDPQALVPLLLEAARGVSDERHWDLVHALRVAGFPA
ncbi:hypothetical protein [Streptomyces sp. S.PNR 29]|uniref:hypothetical protein n=1 Tax=Streptomyces sp. S.PNR 29 TaxID=2973805 RepID=UPI0025B19FB7|nr:hypothetical protein [Streptomyces sp. S.PNR 29]MDN0200792.1 hypothetical protein [Streptomyces sp. S.PNR 29]